MITNLTEQQRAEAIAACDRILASNARLQEIAADILRGIDEMKKTPLYKTAEGRTP